MRRGAPVSKAAGFRLNGRPLCRPPFRHGTDRPHTHRDKPPWRQMFAFSRHPRARPEDLSARDEVKSRTGCPGGPILGPGPMGAKISESEGENAGRRAMCWPLSTVMVRLDRTINPDTPVRASLGTPMVRSSRTMTCYQRCCSICQPILARMGSTEGSLDPRDTLSSNPATVKRCDARPPRPPARR